MMRQETEQPELENETAPRGFVLVVEKDEFSRDLVVRQLSHCGLTVAVAESGRQALDALDHDSFDMIFTASVLSDMGGVEFLRIVRRRFSSTDLPAIAIAPDGDRNTIAECLQAGANDYVTRPFERNVLLSCIETHLCRRVGLYEGARRIQSARDSSQDGECLEPAGDIPAAALDAIGERFVLWDSDDKLVACNQQYRELFGKNTGEVKPGTRFEQLAELLARGGALRSAIERPDAWFAERLARHRKSDSTFEEELVDGSWFRITEYSAADGGVVVLWTDITEVKRREIALKTFAETNRRLAAAINATTSAVLITDARRPGNPTIFANPGFAGMTGWPVEEALGRDRKFLIGPETDAAEATRFEKKMAAGMPATTELCLRTRTGRSFWAEINASSIRDRAGKIANWVIIQTDITGRKQAEEQLRHSQKMKTVGQLTNGLAHDFNNVLTVILGNLETALTSDGVSIDSVRAKLQSAFDAAQRGSELTTRMLAFARRQSWSPSETDIGLTVHDLRDLLARSLGETIQIETVLEENPWPVLVDRVHLENAILNLAVNARDAMTNGGTLTIEVANFSNGARGEIAVDGLEPGDYVRISVTDTGTGMLPGTIVKAMQPFFTTKASEEGTGLGLSLVRGLVGELQGHMRINSAAGSGTLVDLYLPRLVSDIGRDRADRPEPLSEPQEVILLVDDEPQIRAITAIQLKRLGYDVIQAEDGAAALDVIEARRSVDLLVTDIDLPGGMTGVELATSVRGRNPDVRVLYVSGYADGGELSGENDTPFLPKPYDGSALARAVRTALHVA